MATHSSILVWKIPWIEKPGGLQSMRLQRAGHDQRIEHTCTILYNSFSLHLNPKVLMLRKVLHCLVPLALIRATDCPPYLPLLQPNPPSCCSLNMLASYSPPVTLAFLSAEYTCRSFHDWLLNTQVSVQTSPSDMD